MKTVPLAGGRGILKDSILVKAPWREIELVGWGSLEIYFWELEYVSEGARKSKIYGEGQQAAVLQLQLMLCLEADLLLPPRNFASALRTSRPSSHLGC